MAEDAISNKNLKTHDRNEPKPTQTSPRIVGRSGTGLGALCGLERDESVARMMTKHLIRQSRNQVSKAHPYVSLLSSQRSTCLSPAPADTVTSLPPVEPGAYPVLSRRPSTSSVEAYLQSLPFSHPPNLSHHLRLTVACSASTEEMLGLNSLKAILVCFLSVRLTCFELTCNTSVVVCHSQCF